VVSGELLRAPMMNMCIIHGFERDSCRMADLVLM